jgi:Glycosyltransferase WbsX
MSLDFNVVAYYLGQYHPLPENNKNWGDGFTEWHNVAKARKLFLGHNQPILPGSLGFYDLRSDHSLLAQLDYAKSIGVNAFCHWHYWFEGRRVLHSPFDRMLALPNRGVQLMLGWANESWTGIWHGLSNQTIIKQNYNREELIEHAKLVASYVNSERYLKINNDSLFLIYKPKLITEAKYYLEEFRCLVRKFGGGDLYIIGTWGPGLSERIGVPDDFGLDAVVANNVGIHFESENFQRLYSIIWAVLRKIKVGPEIRNYRSTLNTLQAAFNSVNGVVHSSIVTGWDNTPRSDRRGLVLRSYNDSNFEDAIMKAIELESLNHKKIIFLKSWNEWAEGNTIEPKFNEKWSAGAVLTTVLAKSRKKC